jgi:hypothetical protein
MVETKTLALTDPTEPAICERARGDRYIMPSVDIYETDEEWPTMTSRAVTTRQAPMAKLQLEIPSEGVEDVLVAPADCDQSEVVAPRNHLKDRFPGDAEDVSVGDSVFPEGHYATA